jgi:hypothetical protein
MQKKKKNPVNKNQEWEPIHEKIISQKIKINYIYVYI